MDLQIQYMFFCQQLVGKTWKIMEANYYIGGSILVIKQASMAMVMMGHKKSI